MGSTKKRRTYTPDYWRVAAHLVIDTGRTIAPVAAEIRVGAQLLGRWVQAERARIGAPPPEAPLDVSERAELDRLRQENTELRLGNEFLGKAAAFFAASRCSASSAPVCWPAAGNYERTSRSTTPPMSHWPRPLTCRC